jgi:hypothetical protein
MQTLFSESTLQIWALLGTLLGTLLLFAGSLWASRQITQQARELWHTLRGHTPAIIGAVDETTDPLIGQLARLSPVPAAVWATFLPAFFEALADGLDRVLAEDEPAA